MSPAAPVARWALREEVRPGDPDALRAIAASSGFFNEAEIRIAGELVEARLERGPASGYAFVIAEEAGRPVGFTCYGHIDGTAASYDLYWIAVLGARRGQGLGSALLAETERRIARLGGDGVYVETSSRELYEPTRAFYRARGYVEAARLPDFYAPGDAKVVFVKRLAAGRR